MKKLQSLWFMLAAVLVPALAFAQDEPPPDGGEPSEWLQYVAMFIGTIAVPAAVKLLKPLWGGLPSVVKTIVPMVVGPLLVTAGAFLTQLLGSPVDLTGLEQIWLGVAAGLSASLAYKTGEAKVVKQ